VSVCQFVATPQCYYENSAFVRCWEQVEHKTLIQFRIELNQARQVAKGGHCGKLGTVLACIEDGFDGCCLHKTLNTKSQVTLWFCATKPQAIKDAMTVDGQCQPTVATLAALGTETEDDASWCPTRLRLFSL